MARIFKFTDIWKYVLAFVLPCVCSTNTIPFEFKHVQSLNAEAVKELMQTPFVSVIYFYKRDLPRLRAFFKELDKSAEYLEIYGTKTAIVDCNSYGDDVSQCNENRVEHNVYSFRDGSNLITLELETMFDVNSIMSNILQLILLQEVPIIQNHSDRQQLELKNKGKSDIIFAFHKAIGTFEHRVFMEVAYAYQGQYKFGITTETKTLEGLAEESKIISSTEAAIWVLYCREAKEEDSGCSSVRYRGTMDLPSLAIFVKALSVPEIFEMKADDVVPPCIREKINCIFLFHDSTNQDQVMEAAEAIRYEVYGVAGIVIVNVEQFPVNFFEGFDGHTPAISVQKEHSKSQTFMTSQWSIDSIAFFIHRALFDQNLKEEYLASTGALVFPQESSEAPKDAEKSDYNFPTVEEVETQDDQVAEAVFQLNRVPMNLKLVPALTDKTFPTTVQERDLVSVLFYLPFDARSMAFLRAYGEASFSFSDEMHPSSPLVRVNCFDWTDVCVQQNVTKYPVVRIFRKGHDPQDYAGALDTDAVVSTVKLMQMPSSLHLKSVDMAQKYVAGKLPHNVTTYTNMSVLGLFKTENQDLSSFTEVAESLQNITVFAHMTGKQAQTVGEMLGVTPPCVIVFRHDDKFSDPKTLTKDLTTLCIREHVLSSRISTLPELTVDIFPLVYRENKPVLILFCDQYEEEVTGNIKQIVAGISSSGKFPEIIFTWMHARDSSIGAAVYSEYSFSSNLPALTLVYHREGEVYNKEESLTTESISEWLKRVMNKQEMVDKTLPEGNWKPPGRGYDFLALSEYEDKYGSSAMHSDVPESVRSAEDFGFGFQSDGSEVDSGNGDATEEKGDDKEEEKFDEETRNELLELRKSRLYHQAPERKRNDDHMTKRDDHKHGEVEMGESESPKQDSAQVDMGDTNIPPKDKKHVKHTEL